MKRIAFLLTLLLIIAGAGFVSAEHEDITAPILAWLSPAVNEKVSGTARLRVTAIDNETGIYSVVFFLGLKQLGQGNESGNEFWLDFDTLNFENGKHNIDAWATDFAGNRSIRTVSFTIDNLIAVSYTHLTLPTTPYV